MTRVLALAAAAALAACGGSDSTTNPGGCSVTLSGAVTSTLTCAVGAAHDNASNETGIAISVSGSGGLPTFAFAFTIGTGDPQVTTYTPANPGEVGTAYYSGSKAWLQQAHDTGGSPDLGTYSLKITSLGTAITAGGGKAWPLIHGTLDATLKPQTATGASGDLVAKVTF